MKFSVFLTLTASVYSLTVFSTEIPECKVHQLTPERIAKISGQPSFFAKVTADGKYMCYIDGGDGWGNYIMDLDDPTTKVHIPGPYDPVPVPPSGTDHKVQYISVPIGGMSFYSMKKITDKMQKGKTVDLGNMSSELSDRSSYGSYQSNGIVPQKSGNKTVLRTLVGGMSFHDYDISTSPPTKISDHTICRGGGQIQLPMLSKDGQYVSGYDTVSGTTKIFKIEDNGDCKEKLDLGYPVGKVEFSYDNKKIAFHVDSYSTRNVGGMFSGVSGDVTKNVYTLDIDKLENGDLKAGKIRKITNNSKAGNGSYYPSFTEAGKLVYVQGDRDGSYNTKYSFVTVDPNDAAAVDLDVGVATCSKNTAASFALGDLWQKICSNYMSGSIGATDAALWSLSLDTNACKDLVNKYWAQKKSDIQSNKNIIRTGKISKELLKSLTADDLLAACPDVTNNNTQRITLTGGNDRKPKKVKLEKNAKNIFTAQCNSCHDVANRPIGAKHFDWDHLSLDDVNSMIIEISNGSMPKSENIENRGAVFKPLIEELEKRKHQLEAVEP